MTPAAALAAAAALVAPDQKEDGAWRLDVSQSMGSPATYGTALATWSARRTLVSARRPEDAPRIALADRWLQTTPVVTVLDAAAVTLGLEQAKDDAANAQRALCFAVLRKGQSPDGGWGPYVSAPSEPFDTAVVILALTALGASLASDWQSAIERGRKYLLTQQLKDGSWLETTRPARQESYAQRISTTAWATLALFATAPPPGNLKGNGDRLGLGRAVASFEVVHFKRSPDAIAREVFEDR